MRNVFETGEKSENVFNCLHTRIDNFNNVHFTQVHVTKQEYYHATEPADKDVKEAAMKTAQCRIKVILKVTSRTVTSSGCAKKQGPKEPTWLTN